MNAQSGAALWCALFIGLLLCGTEATNAPDAFESEEIEYVTSLFVRLASMHSCSQQLVCSMTTRFPNIPEDSISILEEIADELATLNVQDIRFTPSPVLIATLPASPGYEAAPHITFLGHVDQAGALARIGVFGPERINIDNMTAAKPRAFKNWNGEAVAYPDALDLRLSTEWVPRLASAINKTLITTSGGSPLGADGLAGAVSMIVLARRLVPPPNLSHADGRDCGEVLGGQAGACTVTESTHANVHARKSTVGTHGPIKLVFMPAAEMDGAPYIVTDKDIDGTGVYVVDAEGPGDIRYESPIREAVTVAFEIT
jgi:hypothetical protein